MQGNQVESQYDGMIITNPNLILDAIVPETVQKQAENWVRSTRASFFKSRFKLAQNQRTKHSLGKQRLCYVLKTNGPPSHPRTEERVEKNSQQHPKEDVFEVLQPTPAESSEKIHEVQVAGLHTQQSVSATPDDPAKSICDQEQQEVQDEEDYRFSFEHGFLRSSVEPLIHQNSGIHSYPMVNDASESVLMHPNSGNLWLPNEFLQCNIQPKAGTAILQDDSSLTACIDGDRNDLCMRTAGLHATRSFSPTIPREVQHTTMAKASRGFQRRVPARTSRLMDANVGSSTYVTVPKSRNNGYKYVYTYNLGRGHQQPRMSLLCGSHRPFQQPAQNNVVLPSASTTSAPLSVAKPRPRPVDLTDLSVEETVEYFLKMTSPIGGQFQDLFTNISP